jgi:hydrogenase 3 maturation protease
MSSKGALEELSRRIDARTAFVGLGNRDRGDDAFGLRFIDDLEQLDPGRFLSEEDGLESVILQLVSDKEIRRVIFVDSCDLGSRPGSSALLRLDSIDETISTHKIPLSMLMALLENTGKETWLFGVQPKSLEFGSDMSSEAKRSLEQLEATVKSRLKGL